MVPASFLRSRFATAALLIGASAVFSARLFALVYQKAVNILFLDQWELVNPLVEGRSGWFYSTTNWARTAWGSVIS